MSDEQKFIPKSDGTFDFRRDADRVYAAKPPGADDTTIFPQKQSAADARVRKHRAQQYREWHRRAKGRVATEADVAKFLGEEGGAA